ncbi:MAG: sodium-translocating pyrophosphatase [Phycisphaerae bacterium]
MAISVAVAQDTPVEGRPQEEAISKASIPAIWLIAPVGAVLALIFAFIFYRQVKSAGEGDEKMREIAGYVREGAYAYLRRQYKVVAVFFVIVSLILFVMGWLLHVQNKVVFVAFLTAGFFSGLCGWLGMRTATMASNRATQGAKESLDKALKVAFRAGAVMGLVVVGFALLDVSLWFLILYELAPRFGIEMTLREISVIMLTFAMGASFQALFARVGGGIYTKAADVGADLVGKVEAGIPEDDPRNPATIADNVGDNVGDVAGMGADLYESYYGSILATSALGVAAAGSIAAGSDAIRFMAVPMVLAGLGIILSILGVFAVRTKEGATMKQLMGSLHRGVNGATVLVALLAGVVCYVLLGEVGGVNWWGIWLAILAGLFAGVLIGKSTEYYTSYDFKPTRGISEQGETGPGTVIIAGLAEGMKSTWGALLTVIAAILLAYGFAGGFEQAPLGLYGAGIAAVGMLSTLGITLACDAYGPIADNAGGNAEMTGQPPEVRERTDALDSLGNTTAAMGKGFAIGSAALTTLALLAAYVEEVRNSLVREASTTVVQHVQEAETDAQAGMYRLFHTGHGKFAMKTGEGTGEDAYEAYMSVGKLPDDIPAEVPVVMAMADPSSPEDVLGEADEDFVHAFRIEGVQDRVRVVPARRASLTQFMAHYDVTLMNPKVLCGLFSGVLLVFVFSAMTMKAVGRAANRMVMEVRRQFKEMPGIMEGKTKPDYARCVAISTSGAQREMIIPALLAIVVPVVVGMLLNVSGVMGLLAGGLACGFAMAVFMANAGGAWDNAKKWVETGQLGGKGSDTHKATVVGDTVGDPFKDTSGPSLNILIKLMSIVSVVFAGMVVKFAPQIGALLGID